MNEGKEINKPSLVPVISGLSSSGRNGCVCVGVVGQDFLGDVVFNESKRPLRESNHETQITMKHK